MGLENSLRRLFFGVNKHTKFLILGDGRSGTTWVADVLNFDGRYLDFFESFHGQRVLKLEDRRIYPTSVDFFERSKRFESYVMGSKIFADQQKSKGFARSGCLVKDVTAHMVFPLICNSFDYKVYIIRNPLSVALSKEGFGVWHSDEDLKMLVNSSSEVRELSDRCMSRCLVGSCFHEYVLVWCLLHRIVLSEVLKSGTLVVFYENLLLDPERSFEQLFSHMNMERDYIRSKSKILSAINKRSKTTTSQNRIESGLNGERTWERYKSSSEISDAHEIIRIFKLDHLYQDTIVPQLQPRAIHGYI